LCPKIPSEYITVGRELGEAVDSTFPRNTSSLILMSQFLEYSPFPLKRTGAFTAMLKLVVKESEHPERRKR
jgi:hypothetical protein